MMMFCWCFMKTSMSYESSVRSIAEFMGIKDKGSIQVALERGTFEFMKQKKMYAKSVCVCVPMPE